MIKKILLNLFVFIFCASHSAIVALPESREATILEMSSNSEVLIEAVGIFNSTQKSRRKRKREVKKHGIKYAIEDAKKAAVYYLLYNGTDPILSNEDDIERFQNIETEFFNNENINEMVTYISPSPKNIIRLNRREGVKVIVDCKINRDFVLSILEKNEVIFSKNELIELLGYPIIMVLPQANEDTSPLDVLKENKEASHLAGFIESYLSREKYEVIIPQQTESLNEMVQALQTPNQKDSAYQLALSIGSDIYFDFTVSSSESGYDTEQYAVSIRAYETTTGRLLGSETGYSKARVGEAFLSIEEAAIGAMTNIMARVINYWKEDLEKGIQYKIITTFEVEEDDQDKLYELQQTYLNLLEEKALWTKESIFTNKTVDIRLWCDPERYTKSRLLIMDIKKEFRDQFKKYKLNIINQNRKLIIFNMIKS